MGLMIVVILVGIAYDAFYGAYAVKKGAYGDICYAALLIAFLLAALAAVLLLNGK